MITISKDEALVGVDTAWVQEDMQMLLDALGYEDFDLGIMLTTNDVIRDYNERYRGIDKPTDVLSFPYHLELVAGERIEPESDDDKALGDIIISLEYVQKQKPDEPLRDVVRVLLVHGLCHLLGYTHDADADHEQMLRKEQELLGHLAQSS